VHEHTRIFPYKIKLHMQKIVHKDSKGLWNRSTQTMVQGTRYVDREPCLVLICGPAKLSIGP
jgi:hypothetical protein